MSWYAIEAGWEVVEPGGAVIGSVLSVVGDEDADILDGLRFETASDGPSYVPGDRIGPIVEGRVTVLPGADAEPPGGAEFERDRDTEL